MFRLLVGMVAVALFGTAALSQAPAQKKKVEVTKSWSGSVDDEKAAKPEVITNAMALEAVWKAWKAKGEVPKVDFDKNLVVAIYSRGSSLKLAGVNLDDKGNLTPLGMGTFDLRPGFRYVLGVVSREGIKTVNKKALPK